MPGRWPAYDVLVGNPYDVEFVSIHSIIDKLKAQAADAAARHLGRWATSWTTPR